MWEKYKGNEKKNGEQKYRRTIRMAKGKALYKKNFSFNT